MLLNKQIMDVIKSIRLNLFCQMKYLKQYAEFNEAKTS